MESIRRQRAVSGLLALWVILLAVATAYHSAVNGLTADVVINSVMSLQKVTVFYWGQNRILNVLPAMVWIVRDAAWNLAAVVLLSSATFYAALVMVARLIARGFGLGPWPRYALIAAITSVAPVIFEPTAFGVLAIAHIEYSLPLLLTLIAFSLSSGATRTPRRLVLAAFLLFVAGGLNPGSCLVMLAVAAARFCWVRKVEWCSFGFGAMAVLTLAAWTIISRRYGDSNYGVQDGLSFEQILAGIHEVTWAVLRTVNVPAAVVVLAAVSAATMLRRFVLGPRPAPNPELAPFAYAALIVFSTFWIFTLSVNFWVRQNLYDARYTSFVLFAGLVMLGVWFAQWDWSKWRAVGVVGLALLMGTAARDLAVTQLKSPHWQDFAAFKPVPQGLDRSVRLYAGDYWQVWPAVILQLARNETAYGVVFRGDVMKKRIRDVVKQHAAGDMLDVYCLGADEALCTQQVMGLLTSVRYVGSRNDAGSVRQQYRVVSPGLDYAGDRFLGLPSKTGSVTPGGRATEGKPGSLFFGPYASVPAGRYRLTVSGRTAELPGARVEVAVHAGTQVLLSVVPKSNVSGAIIDQVEVNVPADVTDLEVRATVTASDVMTVSGYSLLPVKP